MGQRLPGPAPLRPWVVSADPGAPFVRHPITDRTLIGTAAVSACRLRHLAGHRHGAVRRRLDPQGLAAAAPDSRPPRADRLRLLPSPPPARRRAPAASVPRDR